MRVFIGWRPVGEQDLLATLQVGLVSWIRGRQSSRSNAARDENHRIVTPPTLSLETDRPGSARQIKQPRAVRHGWPARRFAEVIDSRPQKLSRVSRIVTQGDPNSALVPVLGSQNLASGLLLVRCQDFILTIVLPNHVQQ